MVDVDRPTPVRQRFPDLAGLASAVGRRLGESAWHEVTQRQIDRFAAATGDGPSGRPTAPAYLLLSLVPGLLGEAFAVDGVDMALNTGLSDLRFLGPVAAGAQVRVVADLACVTPRVRGAVEVLMDVRLEVRDRPGPVCRGRFGMILRPVRPTRTRRATAGPTPTVTPR